MVHLIHWFITEHSVIILPSCFPPEVTHFPHTLYHPHSSPRFTLTVDVFILYDQVRVSCMLAITVSPAIMGFELPEEGSGPRAGFGVYVLGRPRDLGLLWCEVWVRARSDSSRLWQVSAHRERVSHPDQWELFSQTFRGSFSAFPWHWYVEHLFWHAETQCKYDQKKGSANKVSFIAVFSFLHAGYHCY